MKSSTTSKANASSAPQKTAKAQKATTTKKAATKPASEKATTVKKKAAVKKDAPKKKGAAKSLKNIITFDKKITDKLKSIVANYTEYPELLDNIERDTTKSFIDELNIDSVDFVEIIVDVEQVFNITIEDEEIYDLKSFEDLYLAIEKKIKGTKKS